jgi:medium-chain acyl-[acyl-carrier-protein] hydrolase
LARALQRKGNPAAHLFVSAVRAPQERDPDPPIHHLPDADLIERVRRWNGIPQAIFEHPDLVAVLLPTLRADLRICETYQYRAGELLDCPISVYGGCDDAKAPSPSLAGWRIQTRKEFVLRLFPGGHFFLETARDALLRQILNDLMRSLSFREVFRP